MLRWYGQAKFYETPVVIWKTTLNGKGDWHFYYWVSRVESFVLHLAAPFLKRWKGAKPILLFGDLREKRFVERRAEQISEIRMMQSRVHPFVIQRFTDRLRQEWDKAISNQVAQASS